MSPIALAACAGIMIVGAGLTDRPWSQCYLGLAVFAGLCSMIEALAMVRIHIDQVMRHRLEQQEYKHTAYGVSPKTGELGPLTSAEYDDLIRKSQEPPL